MIINEPFPKRFDEGGLGKWDRIKTYETFLETVFVDPPVSAQLNFVRIYFDTPTFDLITKDEAVKTVDKISAFGGTMGLLTGFSIISGVEVVYYLIKIIGGLFKNDSK